MDRDYIFIIFNMDKLIFNVNECYEIIPYKCNLNIIYKNKNLYEKEFLLNYNLFNSVTYKLNKNKIHSAVKYLLNNNNNCLLKEHNGKEVFRYINSINIDSLIIRNFIRSLCFLLTLHNKIPVIVSSDISNVKWIINKIYNNKLISKNDIELEYNSHIISDIKYIELQDINNLCCQHLINNKIDDRIFDDNADSIIIDIINKYSQIIIN
jgi:hypothetical protein